MRGSYSATYERVSKCVDIVIPVYNDNRYLAETIKSIFKQRLPHGWSFHLHIVDDGSDDPITVDMGFGDVDDVSIVRLEKNSGCSVARNRGALTGNAEVILFLDADCSLAADNVLALLLEEYIKGCDICFGQIYAPQAGFWARYQNDVARERSVRFKFGETSSMTTSVFMVNRQDFEEVGGFDEAYHFGFEDRDLFLSLIKSGAKVVLVDDAIVNHNDELTLLSVTKKLYLAGKTSSVRFIEKHPKEYKNMHFAKADVRNRSYLRVVCFFTNPLIWALIKYFSTVINKNIMPYFFAKIIVKYLSGLAYLHGTRNANPFQSGNESEERVS